MNETNAKIDKFLKETWIAMLGTLNADGSPNLMPLWYDWDGEKLRMFSAPETGKIRRIARDSRATVLVAAGVGVPEAWVSVEGTVELLDKGGIELSLELAERYYEPEQAKETIEVWSKAESMKLLELTPTRIKSIWGSWVSE